MSALVHATARHFQNVTGRVFNVFDCPEQRNELPYDAQGRWLALYGSLRDEFGVEPVTLMLLTQCVP